MHKLILYIKTYRPDFLRVQNLLRSVEELNADNIPVYISVNDEDYRYFKNNLSGSFTLMRDSDVVKSKMKDKWRHQAIVKPHIYKLGVCENYLCVDSDAMFIRPFYISDFMYDGNTPYTIMHEHKDFMDMLEVLGMDSANIFHVNALRSIRQRFGTHAKNWDYGQNPDLWSCKVWQHFVEVYLAEQKHSFESFYREMELAALPHEAAIYGEYLLKTRLIDILPVEGFFKVYHYKEQYELEKPYFDTERLKKNYMGIIMQSNWNDDMKMEEEKRSFLQRLFGK